MTDKNYFAEVQGFLRLESEAIAQTARRLQREEIERVVQLLAACKGKIVILGVGKSGIIAQKIAATMTSTGTGALYGGVHFLREQGSEVFPVVGR